MLLAMSQFGFSLETLATQAIAAHKDGVRIMGPGTLLADPVSAVSLSLALMFGTAGPPHILMRFFTVPNAKEARKSVFYASGFIGFFFLVVCVIGLAAIVIIGTDPQFFVDGKVGGKLLGGGNMAAMHLAKAVGGDLFLGFLSAVAFATILAVVSGLALAGASAISHDIYANVIRKGKVTERQEVRISKIATMVIGVVAIVLGIVFEKQNLAFMVALTFGVAASANFPVLILAMSWRGLTTKGAFWGGLTGLVTAVGLVILSPGVWKTVLGNAQAVFPYDHPALFSMPLAFLVSIVVSSRCLSARPSEVRTRTATRTMWCSASLGGRGRQCWSSMRRRLRRSSRCTSDTSLSAGARAHRNLSA